MLRHLGASGKRSEVYLLFERADVAAASKFAEAAQVGLLLAEHRSDDDWYVAAAKGALPGDLDRRCNAQEALELCAFVACGDSAAELHLDPWWLAFLVCAAQLQGQGGERQSPPLAAVAFLARARAAQGLGPLHGLLLRPFPGVAGPCLFRALEVGDGGALLDATLLHAPGTAPDVSRLGVAAALPLRSSRRRSRCLGTRQVAVRSSEPRVSISSRMNCSALRVAVVSGSEGTLTARGRGGYR